MAEEPTAKSEVKAYRVALEDIPDFAAQVGVLLSLFAILEGYVPQLIARLTGMSDKDSFVSANSFMSFSHRIDLLESYVGHRPDNTETKPYRHFVETLREANMLRNRFAHGLYSTTSSSQVIIKSWTNDARRKTRTERYNLDRLSADVARIKFIICELHGFIYRNEHPA